MIPNQIEITMADLQPGDKVLCSDGVYRDFELLEVHIPEKMFNFKTTAGNIKSSGDHLWTLWNGNHPITITSQQVAYLMPLGYAVGVIDGPTFTGIEEIEPEPVRCIQIDSEDHLFEVLTDQNEPLLAHNCGFRGVAGPVGVIASLMALGNSLGTTVDASKPGRGIVQSQGKNERIQYYFEDHKFIEDYYADRGLDKRGWPMSAEQIANGGQMFGVVPEEEDVIVPLEDLPIAIDEIPGALSIDLTDFEFAEAQTSNLTIDEMNINIEVESEEKPIGNIEI